MEGLFWLVISVLALIALISYFKNTKADLRVEQLKVIKQSFEIVVGFTLTTTKDLVKLSAKAGKAAAATVEKEHSEAVHKAAKAVEDFKLARGTDNALTAGVKASKEFQSYTGIDSLSNYLGDVINPQK